MSKKHSKVYIIESPSPTDILDKRKEGSALSEMLTLARIQNNYYNVVDIDTLNQAFGRITTDINNVNNTFGLVDLHFSMHGNKKGLLLTNGEFVTWEMLYKIIKRFNDKIGYGSPHWAPERKFSMVSLNFSVCEGFYAKILDQFGEESAYTSLLGPTCRVDWSDSLMAFAAYYHHTIHKGTNWWESIPIMNLTAGLKNVFKMEIAKGLYPQTIPNFDDFRLIKI